MQKSETIGCLQLPNTLLRVAEVAENRLTSP
jgi:hypothetical protein